MNIARNDDCVARPHHSQEKGVVTCRRSIQQVIGAIRPPGMRGQLFCVFQRLIAKVRVVDPTPERYVDFKKPGAKKLEQSRLNTFAPLVARRGKGSEVAFDEPLNPLKNGGALLIDHQSLRRSAVVPRTGLWWSIAGAKPPRV